MDYTKADDISLGFGSFCRSVIELAEDDRTMMIGWIACYSIVECAYKLNDELAIVFAFDVEIAFDKKKHISYTYCSPSCDFNVVMIMKIEDVVVGSHKERNDVTTIDMYEKRASVIDYEQAVEKYPEFRELVMKLFKREPIYDGWK